VLTKSLDWLLPRLVCYWPLTSFLVCQRLASFLYHRMVMSSVGGAGPVLPSSPNLLQPLESKSATVVVAEGFLWCREKIRRWEYVKMADLLKNDSKDTQLSLVNGQLVVIHRQVNSKSPLTILQWLQACNIFTAILLSASETTKEESAGLAAHACLIIQLSQDLQWLHYKASGNGSLPKG